VFDRDYYGPPTVIPVSMKQPGERMPWFTPSPTAPPLPTLRDLASEALAFSGADRGTAIGSMVRRLLDDERLREGLVLPILNNVCAGMVSSVRHNNRDLERTGRSVRRH
jgi:hypothetical protein